MEPITATLATAKEIKSAISWREKIRLKESKKIIAPHREKALKALDHQIVKLLDKDLAGTKTADQIINKLEQYLREQKNFISQKTDENNEHKSHKKTQHKARKALSHKLLWVCAIVSLSLMLLIYIKLL